MTTFNDTLNLNKNAYVFNSVKSSGSITMFNYDQIEKVNMDISTNTINIIDNIRKPEVIFDLNDLFIDENLIIESKIQPSFVINTGFTHVTNDININDKFKALEVEFKDNVVTNNLNINNKTYYQFFLKKLLVNGNKNINYLNNIISYNNTHIKTNLNILNNFSNNILIYDNLNIKHNIHTKNNLNIFNDIFIGEAEFKDIKIKSIEINNSLTTKIFKLPHITDKSKNFTNGSIAYNSANDSFFAFIDNKSMYINKKNENGNTKINQKFPNVDFIANNLNIININYNTSSLSIKSYVTNIKNNLNVLNDVNIKNNNYNTFITETLNTDDLIFKNDSNFVISSNINYNTNIHNSSIRYNNLTKVYEKYFDDKWIPLLDISNTNKTTYLELQSLNEPNKINNTIMFYSNNKTVFKLNNNNILFNSYNHYLPNNATFKKQTTILNNINCNSLYMNNNKSNVRFINNNNKIYYNNKLIYTPNTTLYDTQIHNSYNFYIMSIKNTYKKCNTINSIISSDLFINNSIIINNYKLYNNITVTNIIIYLNKKCDTSLVIKVSNNNTEYTVPFKTNNILNDYAFIDTNILLSTNENLNISVKSTNNIDNLSANIYIKTKNRDSYGLIYPNNTSIFIDKNNNIDLEDRNFYGNLNIENNINININNDIQVKKSVFINQPLNIRSNNNNNLLSIFNNNNKPLFYVNNNNIGFFTNQFIKHNTCVINSNINVDKNVSCDFNFNIKGNTYVSNNLNIQDTIFINNINTIANINITNNVSVNVLGNGTFTKNLNVINNINVFHQYFI